MKNPNDYTFFQNVDSFLSKFPNCCQVGKTFTANEDSLWFGGLALLGYRSSVVYIEYEHPDKVEMRNAGQPYGTKGSVAITNCGLAWSKHVGLKSLSDLNLKN